MTLEPQRSPLTRLVQAVPEPAYRVAGLLFFLAGFAHKLAVRETYANQLLWGLEASIFLLLAGLYSTRRPAVERARGAREILLPLLGGAWPFLLLATPRGDFGLRHQPELLAVMACGSALALAGYVALGRSFSIMVEAREPRFGGPYRWMRHPIYAGQILAATAVVAWRFSPGNVFLLLGFCAIQLARARLEEAKLAACFPAYAEILSRRPAVPPLP